SGTTPTFTWDNSSLPAQTTFQYVYIISMDNEESDDNPMTMIFTAACSPLVNSVTVPSQYSMSPGQYMWAPIMVIEPPSGGSVMAIGIESLYHGGFWVTSTTNPLGSISGTITASNSVTSREFVYVALFDSPNPEDSEPINMIMARYNDSNDNWYYSFNNLEDGDYYVFAIMDIEPYGLDGGPSIEDAITSYDDNMPPLEVITINNHNSQTIDMNLIPNPMW
ncbi:MAG: hypothetical protein ABIH42_06760, partial [Planctomycetota bacterium]